MIAGETKPMIHRNSTRTPYRALVRDQVEKTSKETANHAACDSSYANRRATEESVVRSRHGDGSNDAARRRTKDRA